MMPELNVLQWAGVVLVLYAFLGSPTPRRGKAFMLGLVCYLIGLFLTLV